MWLLVAIFAIGVAVVATNKKKAQTTPATVSDGIKAVAEAIARAEGFYKVGTVPKRANNPGDLEIGDRGYGTIGAITVFASPADGWNALYRQLALVRSGKSKNFKPTDSWREFARTWVRTPDYVNWLATVTTRLGASQLDSVGGYLA